MVNEEAGGISITLTLVLAVCLVFSLGTWGVLRHWRGLATTQLRLDRCAGQAAQDFRHTLESVQKLNRAMTAARTTLAATLALPQVAEAAKAALHAAFALQELVVARWTLKQGLWLARGGCSGGSIAEPLPSLPYTRDPPDPIGPRPLRWTGERAEFRIQVHHSPRHAAALVKGESTDASEPSNWLLRWAKAR